MNRKKNPGGRPTKMTPTTLQKLREAFLMGCSDEEACLYADIMPSTLYNYQKANPEYLEEKEYLKERPVLDARQTVVKAIKTDPEMALKYLERKKKAEFSTKSEIDITSKGEQIVGFNYLPPADVTTNNTDNKTQP